MTSHPYDKETNNKRKKPKFGEHGHRDMFHADIVIESVDDVHIPRKTVDPDIQRKPFRILRSKKIDPPGWEEEHGDQGPGGKGYQYP